MESYITEKKRKKTRTSQAKLQEQPIFLLIKEGGLVLTHHQEEDE